MIFIALKIIRKLFGVVFKLVKLPFKLVSLFAGSQAASGDSITGESTETTSSEMVSSKTGGGALSEISSDKSPQEAQKYLNWLQYGMIGLGLLQAAMVFVTFISLRSAALQGSQFGLPFILATGIIVGLIPITIGMGLRRNSKIAWYAAMIYVILNSLSIFTSPSSAIIQVPLVIGFGYLGLNSKPAIGTTVDRQTSSEEAAISDTTQANPTESTDRQTPADDPARSEDAAAGQSPEGEKTSDQRSEKSVKKEIDSDESSEQSSRNSEKSNQEGTATSEKSSNSKKTEPEIKKYESRLSDENPTERREACEELATAINAGEVSTDAAVDQLSAILENDNDTSVRKAACEALGTAGTPSANEVLETHRLDSDREISQTASRVLRDDNI